MKRFRVTAVFLTLVCCQSLVLATHIVGGDFYYKKLGINYYQITLKLYIDCFKGDTGAIKSDAEAYIAIFDAGNNQLEESLVFTRTGPVRVNKRQYSCVVPDPNACVDQYTYVRDLYIDPGQYGKILSFQRCCRNNSINNIINPMGTGATYWVKIPGTNTVSWDNSPIFKELPPNYLCTGAPLVFDHSATDADGDSLVYELYQPFLGANRDQPRPNNSTGGDFANPPFENILWRPPYATENQMAGQPILEIDSRTGELTVIPNIEGQFVIGVKVKEYRNGELIGETLRDYQFNVRACQFDLISVFFVPYYSCVNTVIFDNKSYKAAEYYWDFGDPSTLADTSHMTNPTWTYPGNGDYRVSLKAKNKYCEDIYTTTVKIRSKILLELGPDIINCTPTNRLLSTRLFDNPKTIWSTGQTSPYITVSNPDKYWVSVAYGACTASDTVVLKYYPVNFIGPDDAIYCDTVRHTMTLDFLGQTNLKCRWNNSLKDSFASYYVSKPGAYTVRVNNGPCLVVDTVNVYLAGKPKIGPYFFVCNAFNKSIDAGDYVPKADYLWSDGSTNRFLDINKQGTYWVKVMQGPCSHSDTLLVENPVIQLDLGPDKHYCDSVEHILTAPASMASYLWSDGSSNQMFTAKEEGKYWVEVFDTNGCQKSDTVAIDVTESPTVFAGNDTTICARTEVQLGTSNDFVNYKWNTGSDKKQIAIQNAGEYVLVVMDKYGCTGTDTVRITVDLNALPNELFIANAFSPNDDGLNEYFPFTEKVIQPEFNLKIYDRWGEKVFDSKELKADHWNGIYKAGVIRPDAFVYLVEYRGCDGDYRRKFGTVTVLK